MYLRLYPQTQRQPLWMTPLTPQTIMQRLTRLTKRRQNPVQPLMLTLIACRLKQRPVNSMRLVLMIKLIKMKQSLRLQNLLGMQRQTIPPQNRL